MRKKLKTRKSVSTRFKITKKGKVLFRPPGQNHFLAKKSSHKKRKKKNYKQISGAIAKYIKSQIR